MLAEFSQWSMKIPISTTASETISGFQLPQQEVISGVPAPVRIAEAQTNHHAALPNTMVHVPAGHSKQCTNIQRSSVINS